jgi:hypothetical protein
VTNGGGLKLTVPNADYVKLSILEDLG